MDFAPDPLPEKLLDAARRAGAAQAEVYQVRSRSYPVTFEANRLKQLESSQSEGTALRLWREGRPGLAVAYGPVAAEALVARALALTDLTDPETPELSPPRQASFRDRGETVAVEDLIELGKTAIATIRETYPEAICAAEFESETETVRLCNSEGLDCQYSDTLLSYFIGAEWVRGEDFLGVYDGEELRGRTDAKQPVRRILQRLDWAQVNVAAPKGRVPILLTPNGAMLLWGTVAAALNGKRVLEKSSPWSDRLGTPVAAAALTLTQEPERGPHSCPFDDEGVPTQPLTLIADGCLQQFYCDLAIARALGTHTTGNGFRPSLGRYPTPELVNLFIAPGRGTLETLIGELEEAIVIDQVLGGGADISGDFSVNIDLGYYVRHGEIIGRIKDTMIAGNVYGALKQITAIAEDLQESGSCSTPSLVVEGLSTVSS
ncbi:MAG: TldD/PmbA family protein [Chloroflexaceae bacterium]|nr:TldD/PmbA family protein [Chloroflexaceae bacterium]